MIDRAPRCRCTALLLAALATFATIPVEATAATPRLADERLELVLFAEDPQIVTPIGMAIDTQDRVYVIESHTHHPPTDYAGPKSDRIKRLVDADNDGRPEQVTVFADGLREAMNLAFAPDGGLYVVCAREVVRLVDADRDGVCERRDRVLELVTRERYAHNSLLGITFDRDGWLYVSRGNVASHAYRFQGTDGTTVAGYGDGGNVVRCRPDGTQLQEFATGFWNPFDLKFDRHGRLLLVDNDPDARGPNRLVHVVPGGDYGYKSLYGGGGNHPFQGWDGTLAGTLPYIAGTGEAPSGVMDCRRVALPADYADSVLVTSWNENSVEQFRVTPRGSSLEGEPAALFLTGPQDFRPVAIDADSRGNLFVTDWVLVDYPNHGRGRIWRVRARDQQDVSRPQAYFDPYLPDPAGDERRALAQATEPDVLTAGLASSDPFVRHAATVRLADPALAPLRAVLGDHADSRVRLGVLLAAETKEDPSRERLRQFLSDSDEAVRHAALVQAGESLDHKLLPDLELALAREPVGAALFEAYLAAVENLDPAFIAAYRAEASPRAKDLPRRLDPGVLLRVAKDERFADVVRGLAIGRFDDATAVQQSQWLRSQLSGPGDGLALAAIRRVAALPQDALDSQAAELSAVALDPARSSGVRCDAILALAAARNVSPRNFIPLLQDSEADVAIEAARTFRAWLDAGLATDCVPLLKQLPLADEVKERLQSPLHAVQFETESTAKRPVTNDEWSDVLQSGGEAERGRRVFFTARVACARCHTIDGRGGVLGPDLSGVAQSKSRRQIVDAILDPSAEFPPQYQAWLVVTTDGRIHRGLQLDHKAGGAIALLTDTGANASFRASEIETYEASRSSLMPAGLADTMTVGEFQDLIAFLASLK